MKIQKTKLAITVFESSLYRTTSTIIGFDSSVIIVDPNWLPHEIEMLQDNVEKYHAGKEQFLLFTHSDYDHIIGYEAFKGAKVIASEAFVHNKSKEKIINQIHDFDNEYYINRPYPITYPVVDIVVTESGQSIQIDNHELIFFLSPGHASDGLFTIIPKKNCWIAGDYLSNIEIPFVDFDIYGYEKTLIAAHKINEDFPNIDFLIPGHGDVAESHIDIKRRIENDLKYILLLKNHNSNPTNIKETDVVNHIRNYSKNTVLMTAHHKNLNNLKLHSL